MKLLIPISIFCSIALGGCHTDYNSQSETTTEVIVGTSESIEKITIESIKHTRRAKDASISKTLNGDIGFLMHFSDVSLDVRYTKDVSLGANAYVYKIDCLNPGPQPFAREVITEMVDYMHANAELHNCKFIIRGNSEVIKSSGGGN